MPDYTANISYPQEVCQQSKCRSFVHINRNFALSKVHNAHKNKQFAKEACFFNKLRLSKTMF